MVGLRAEKREFLRNLYIFGTITVHEKARPPRAGAARTLQKKKYIKITLYTKIIHIKNRKKTVYTKIIDIRNRKITIYKTILQNMKIE